MKPAGYRVESHCAAELLEHFADASIGALVSGVNDRRLRDLFAEIIGRLCALRDGRSS